MINKWRSGRQIKRKLDSKETILLKKVKRQEYEKKIKYLEAKVAYLEAEKDFLINLPKKKRNQSHIRDTK